MELNRGCVVTESIPCVLLAEENGEFGSAMAAWLAEHDIGAAYKNSLSDAATILRDAIFTNAMFDGLLISFNSRNPSYRLITEFGNEFPDRPIAVLAEEEDKRLQTWAGARDIMLLKKPFELAELDLWAARVKSVYKRRSARRIA